MASTPGSIATITPAWLTQVLRKNGHITESRVADITSHRIGAEFGFLDNLARLVLAYDQTENNAPTSLVVKISSSEALYRQIGAFYHAYEREFHFYEIVAPHSPIRLPRCYGREVDPETNAHILILEDLGSLSAGDQVKGLTPAQAQASVETIGRFHACWWETSGLDSLSWMPRRNIQPTRYQTAWPLFRDVLGSHLSASAIALGDHLSIHLETLLGEIEKRPHTIVHSDFRADNLLFDEASQPEPVVILDWQLAIRAMGVLDVARLLCGSMNPHDRSVGEMDLLRRWHETLELGGVHGYPFKRAIEDYRLCALICLYYPVTIHGAEEAAGVRGTALAHAQIDRFFTAAVELNDSFRL